MTEILSYSRWINLNEVCKKMDDVLRYNVRYTSNLEGPTVQGSWRVCQGSIYKAFKLVDWLSKPYQPMDVDIGPEDGYPDGYLESVHRLLSRSAKLDLVISNGSLILTWLDCDYSRIGRYRDDVLRIPKFIEGVRYGSIYC